MELGLKNKRALILGSSSGLGLSIAEALSLEGCNLILASRNIDKLESVRDQLQKKSRVNCDIFGLDLTDTNSVDSFTESLKNIDVDILINNTGGPPPSNTTNTQASVWETYVQSIIVNIIKITDIVLPSMKEKKWGRIITITSSGVVQPIDNLLVSNTLRPAITGYMKTLDCRPTWKPWARRWRLRAIAVISTITLPCLTHRRSTLSPCPGATSTLPVESWVL